VTDEVSFQFTPAPTVDAGADAMTCANNASVSLNGSVTIATGGLWSGGAGTFAPNNSTLNATYAPSAAEIAAGTVTLTLTTVGNGICNPVSDQMVIAINPSPIVSAGSAIAILREQPCGGNCPARCRTPRAASGPVRAPSRQARTT
jgi:hypothetical protein